MKQIIVSMAIAAGLFAGLAPGLEAGNIGEPTPPPSPPGFPDLCAPKDPARAINVAMKRGPELGIEFVIAVASPLTKYGWETGIEVEIHRVLVGEFTLQSTKSDVHGTDCIAERVWESGEPVLGIFFISPEDETTLYVTEGWPLKSAAGEELAKDSPSLASEPEALQVQLWDGGTVTVDELMELGRNFVEPTPTPLPPGVPTPPADLEAPDTDGRTGVTAPNAGAGASGGVPYRAYAAIAAAAGTAMLLSALAFARRRGP
jgi:hypothetical protein